MLQISLFTHNTQKLRNIFKNIWAIYLKFSFNLNFKMNIFRIFSNHEHRWNRLDRALSSTFRNVKKDISVSFSWIKYFKELESHQEKKFKKIVHHLTQHQLKIRELEHEVVRLKTQVEMQKKGEIGVQYLKPEQEIRESDDKTGNKLVEKLTSAINSQRQDYVIKKILDLTEKGMYSTKQIEDFIVKEQGLCGRTTFYQYLRDLRNRRMILQEKKNGKPVLSSHKK